MKCRGYQFTMGEWHEHYGEVEMCKSGFHFCQTMIGPILYYNDSLTRVFEIEAEHVIGPEGTGTPEKFACKRIRFLREVTQEAMNAHNDCRARGNSGNCNTGYRNTGNFNAGGQNTGNHNTGDSNTGNDNRGNRNAGSCNVGSHNTGSRNNGVSNSGGGNSGSYNTGHNNTGSHNSGTNNNGNFNAGHSNIGDYNAGDCNIGNHNTGLMNITNYSTGFFCTKEPNAFVLDQDTGIPMSEFMAKYSGEISTLVSRIHQGYHIDFYYYTSRIPFLSEEKLKAFIEAHKAKRKEIENDNRKVD